ncbi:6-phospho-3-hexuloisomerase [Paenibacillus sp. GCM10023252]|uniref:6-phospho-3-hexuloisomerase n=1 Tax=Paenibacillus sp. GCM10023252 TaxID=3252649 RepID=UPI00361F91D2
MNKTGTLSYAEQVAQELSRTAAGISAAELEELAERIAGAGRIFVAGAGRSGLVAKAFAMRLMQLGLDSHIVGDTVTPSAGPEDLLLIGSGSGETKGLISIAEKAAKLGTAVAAVTTAPQSTIGKLASVVVTLPGASKEQGEGSYRTIQPMGTLYEQTLLVFYDAVVLQLMDKLAMTTEAMLERHANLE